MRMCPHRIGEEIEFNDSTDPNDLWASTTWNQVTDGRVTLASSSSHALGTTGGSETHTLTTAQMPKHGHTVSTWISAGTLGPAKNYDANYGASTQNATGGYQMASASGGGWKSASFNCAQSGMGDQTGIARQSGNGQAHNNMQPWRAVNRWRRVA